MIVIKVRNNFTLKIILIYCRYNSEDMWRTLKKFAFKCKYQRLKSKNFNATDKLSINFNDHHKRTIVKFSVSSININ